MSWEKLLIDMGAPQSHFCRRKLGIYYMSSMKYVWNELFLHKGEFKVNFKKVNSFQFALLTNAETLMFIC